MLRSNYVKRLLKRTGSKRTDESRLCGIRYKVCGVLYDKQVYLIPEVVE